MKHVVCKAVAVGPAPKHEALPRDLLAALGALRPDDGYTARDVMHWAIRTQPQFTENMPGMLSAARIDTAIRRDGVVVLDNEDHERLVKAIAEPRGGYPIQPPHPLLPLLLEIQGATDEPPETS